MASKRLYVMMAKTIKRHVDIARSPWESDEQNVPLFIIKGMVSDLCSDLADDNPRFSKTRFMEACGL